MKSVTHLLDEYTGLTLLNHSFTLTKRTYPQA